MKFEEGTIGVGFYGQDVFDEMQKELDAFIQVLTPDTQKVIQEVEEEHNGVFLEWFHLVSIHHQNVAKYKAIDAVLQLFGDTKLSSDDVFNIMSAKLDK